MIRQCAILFGCLALGELLVRLSNISLPASVVGMLILTLLLHLGWIKLSWVQDMSELLISNIGFFFIPPGVGLMLHISIIKTSFWSIALSTVLSTALVLITTGWVHQAVRKYAAKNGSTKQ